jgi:hypothetical protein
MEGADAAGADRTPTPDSTTAGTGRAGRTPLTTWLRPCVTVGVCGCVCECERVGGIECVCVWGGGQANSTFAKG